MNAVIRWEGGEKVIEGAGLGDPRVAEFLDQLAERRAKGVTLSWRDTAPVVEKPREDSAAAG